MMSFAFILPFARFSGEGYDLGYSIGKKFQQQIQSAFQKSSFLSKLREIDKKQPEFTDDLIKQGKKFFPIYVEELKGISEGASVKIRDVFLLNFRHSFNFGCSSVLFKDNSSQTIYLGHNEDHEIIMAQNSYLALITNTKGLSYITHLYPGCLVGPTFWFNSYGIGLSGNAINEPKKPSGIPKGLLDRRAVEARTMKEILSVLTKSGRSGGYSYNIFSQSENLLVNLETTSTIHDVLQVSSTYLHTNHYIHPQFNYIPHKKGQSSDKRLKSLHDQVQNMSLNKNKIRNLLLHPEVYVQPNFEQEQNKSTNKDSSIITACTCCTALFMIKPEKIVLEIYSHSPNHKLTYGFEKKRNDSNIISTLESNGNLSC